MLGELFTDAADDDYSIRSNCIAVDFCPQSPAAADDDILAQPRDSLPDAGCYEYDSDIAPSLMTLLKSFTENWLSEEPSESDINGDGIVNLSDYARITFVPKVPDRKLIDLNIFAQDWLFEGVSDFDFDQNGIVNFIDYAEMLNQGIFIE
jgi:hypothetical protein